jgi:hypothetical protein
MTLGFTTPTANQTYNLPNSAAGTYTICTSANNCTGLGAYIQNGTTLQASASFNIQTGTTTNDTAVIRQLASQTGQLLRVVRSDGTTNVLAIDGSTGATQIKSITDGANAFTVQQASSTTNIVAVDTSAGKLSVRTLNDTATLSAELYNATNNFNTDFTHVNWTVSPTTEATHVTGNTSALVNTSMAAPVNGTDYQVSFNISGACGTSADSITVTFAGATVSGGAITGEKCNGTFSYVITASATSPKITFTPTANWGGTISNLSIKSLSGAVTPALVVLDTTGSSSLEIRASSSGTNTLIGINAGQQLAGASYNTAVGYVALSNVTSGSYNTAFGATALQSNVTGSYNVAQGFGALQNNVSGDGNTAYGNSALNSNINGAHNTADVVTGGCTFGWLTCLTQVPPNPRTHKFLLP